MHSNKVFFEAVVIKLTNIDVTWSERRARRAVLDYACHIRVGTDWIEVSNIIADMLFNGAAVSDVGRSS